jgi:hypothetical protein
MNRFLLHALVAHIHGPSHSSVVAQTNPNLKCFLTTHLSHATPRVVAFARHKVPSDHHEIIAHNKLFNSVASHLKALLYRLGLCVGSFPRLLTVASKPLPNILASNSRDQERNFPCVAVHGLVM